MDNILSSPHHTMDVKVLIIVLFGLCNSQAFHTLIPEGKELIYEYYGTISASTDNPRPYSTYFGLHGNLHVQRDNRNVLLKFSDLEYKLFNGLDDEFDSKILPIPKEMEDFTKAFRIDYQPTGNIAGIVTGKDEKQYVVNFKKGISSMFQLDLEMMEQYDNQDIYAFHTEEHTMYGTGKVNYNVKADKDTYYVEVMQEPRSTMHMYNHLFTNINYQPHRFDFNEPLTRDSQRRCVLTKVGNDKIINNIELTGGVYNTPFNGNGEAHAIYTNQTVSLTSTIPISSKFEIESEVFHEGLTYYIADLHNVNSTFPDLTNGRRTLPSKEIMTDNAVALIKEIIDLVTKYEIEENRPDVKKNQIVHSLMTLMLFFDETALDEMYEKLTKLNDEACINIYIQMLIELGTHAGYRQVLKLKHEGKIEDDSFLYNMFKNVKLPNKELVDEMAEILKWDSKDYPSHTYAAAVLSFATLLNKAIERNKRYTHNYPQYFPQKHHKLDYNPDNELAKDFPDHKYYEKYVLVLVRKLKEAKRYDHQILYLEALYNTKMDSIVQHLLPAIKGEWWKDNHLRMLAALAVNPIVSKNEDLTYEIYWPFMTNPNTPTTFRIMSYLMIMKTQPRLPRLINIYWAMESMKNNDVYTFHYKYITAISESENRFNRKFIMNIKQILKYTYKPVFRGITEYQRFDYFDDDYSFGEGLELITIHSKLENDVVLSGSYKYHVNGVTREHYWFLLRIAGFHPSFLKALKLDTTSKTFLFTWDTLKNVLINLSKSDDVKVTLVLATDGHVMSTFVYDKNNIMELSSLLKQLKLIKINESSVDVSYDFFKTIILPTEIGFPVMSFNYVPDIDYTNISFSQQNDGFTFDVEIKSLRQANRGLSFYNPFLDVTQAVSKLHFADSVVNFNLKASYDAAHHTLKMSWMNEAPDEVLLGEKMYTSTMVNVNDAFNPGILQKSAPKCNNYEFVTLGDDYKTNKTTRTLPLIDIGSYFVEKVFDLEEPLPIQLDPQIDMNSDKSNDFLKEFFYPLTFEEIQPADVNYGMIRTVRASDKFPVQNVDLTLKFDTEYKKGNNYLYPAVSYKMKLHCASGGSAGTFTSWSADAKLEMDDGHMNTVFGGHISKKIGENVVSFCIAGDSALTLPNENTCSSHLKSTIYLSSNLFNGDMCAKNNSMFEISIHGKKSPEQRKGKLNYETCHENVMGPIENQKSLDCLFEYDSLRHYTVDIKHFIPDDKDGELREKWSEWTSYLFTDRDSIDAIEGIKSNQIRAVFDLPMKPAEFSKLKVYTEDSGTSYQLSEKLLSLNTAYGSMFELMHDFGLTDVCLINHHKSKCTNTNGVEHAYTPSKEWMVFLASAETETKFVFSMKSSEGNDMVLKFEVGSHTLIVEPKDNAYIFTMDGYEIKRKVWTNEWMHYACITDTKLVSIYIHHIGVHVIYNGHQASIEYLQIEGVKMDGYCLYGGQSDE